MSELNTVPSMAESGAGHERHADQTRFFSDAFLDGAAIARQLAEARVVVLGAGVVGSYALRALADAGVGSIGIIDAAIITERDAVGNVLLGRDDIGIPRAEAAARAVHGVNAAVEGEAFVADAASADELRAVISGMHAVVVAHDSPLPAVLDAINGAALATGVPWISGRIARGSGFVGPTVLPWQSPCFKCYELRRNANAEDYDLLLQYEAQFRERSVAPAECITVLPLAATVGSLLALETVRLLSRAALPQTIGRILRVDFFAPEMTSHRMLRVPRCPACGYDQRRAHQHDAQLSPGN